MMFEDLPLSHDVQHACRYTCNMCAAVDVSTCNVQLQGAYNMHIFMIATHKH